MDEVSQLPEWDFSKQYSGPDDDNIRAKLNQALSRASNFQDSYKGKVSQGNISAAELKSSLEEIEEILEMAYPISMYSRLLSAKDTQNAEYQQFVAVVQEKMTSISNHLVFFGLEINKIDEDIFSSYINDEGLANYKHYLVDLRKYEPYQLIEEEEQMISLKDQYGKMAFRRLYNELTSSWTFEIEIDGELKKMSGSQIRALRMHPDQDVRSRAMKMFFERYEKNELVIGNVFNNLFKDYFVENQKRGYPTPITRRNMGNEIPGDVVEVLGEATTNSYPKIVHRYYKLKKKILGLEELTLADIYAPIPEVNKKYSWEEAENLVLDSFGEFDQEFRDIVRRMLDEKRVDAPPSLGKRGGAFCAGSSPKEYPWVFLNYNENVGDISTLAHELGHAIHSVLGMKQTQLNFGLSLVTAEVASVFSEMIFSDYMLTKTNMSKEEKIAFISKTLEGNIATSHRQNMFYNWEIMVHELIKEKIITTDEYCDIYESELKKMFGDSVTIPEEYRWEWSTIPHFISVYHYVYAYNMSNLLVLALYGLYLEEGETFIPKFKKLLTARKAQTPEDMLNEIGIDIRDKSFWDRGLKYLEGMIDQLEELLED